MRPQLSLNKELSSCEPILLPTPRKLSKRRVEPDVDCQPSRHHHAILLTPVNESIARSVTEDVPPHPKSNAPVNAYLILQRLRLGRSGQ